MPSTPPRSNVGSPPSTLSETRTATPATTQSDDGSSSRFHFEPFVHLAGLDDDQALIAWGGFWYVESDDGSGMRIVHDEELSGIEAGRTDSIGLRSMPYGRAVVEAVDPDGRIAATATTEDQNHAWLSGLTADTEYRYRITVDDRPWADGELMSWHRIDGECGELRPAGRGYDLRFRTFPDRESHADLTFVAIGDYGVGIQSAGEVGPRQLDLARAMEETLDHHDVRLVLALGDNIYHKEGESVGGSGSEDDDWYWSFYEPYRWLISRVPLFPAVGNHDTDDTEDSDDREQLNNNHFIDLRFLPEVEEGRASIDPGLFYRLDYSRRVRFLCIDSSESNGLDTDRFFWHDEHADFIDNALSDDRADSRWRIPFMHHPPFCAGPKHGNDDDMIEHLVPRFEERGVRLVLSGHEHNFQYARHGGVDYVVSGAGGKLRSARPADFHASHTEAWAAEGHFLLIVIDGEDCTIWPVRDVDDDGTLHTIDAEAPDGSSFELPIRLTL